jgi:CheY-like chemotaxis protein
MPPKQSTSRILVADDHAIFREGLRKLVGGSGTLSGDTAKARTAYQDFLALWKDADPDIPVLIAAKSEYAKVKQCG